MKTIFLLSVGIAFAFMVVSCSPNSKSAPGGDPAGAIVYVNSDTLLAKYNFSIDQNKQFKATADSLQNILQGREAAFQNSVNSYQKGATTMSDAQRKQTEGVLGQQQQELQQLQQVFQQQASQKQLDLTKQLSKKLQDFLKDYSSTHHYKMVMIYSQLNSGILYGDPSLDITTDLLKELNAAYTKEKK
jgi:outer membrane protein